MKEIITVKEVLFGQQKQSNEINTIIAEEVCKELLKLGYFGIDEESHAVVTEGITRFVNDVNDKIELASLAFKFIAGRKSVKAIEDDVPRQVVVSPISDESTKVTFRVEPLLGEVEPEQLDVEVNEVKNTPDIKDIDRFSFREQAEMLKNKLVPLASDVARKELADNEYALALVCAKGYFTKGE